jgi:hypothetical protein
MCEWCVNDHSHIAPLKMELTLGSETSAFKTQMPGNNPEDYLLLIVMFSIADLYSLVSTFNHSTVCLTSYAQTFPKRRRHKARSSTISFNFHCILGSLKPLNSCLRLLPLFSSVFHLIACFKRQFLRKMWPIKFVFIVCRIFLCASAVCNIS